jgi:hypothetical protein
VILVGWLERGNKQNFILGLMQVFFFLMDISGKESADTETKGHGYLSGHSGLFASCYDI